MRISNLHKLKDQHNHEGIALLTWSNWEREAGKGRVGEGEEKMKM